MKDYRVQVKVKNNRILQAIEDAGYKTCGGFCVATGLRSSEIGNYINFKKSPLLKSGEWSVKALRLAEILRTTPDHLFSEVQKTLEIKRNAAERTFTAVQMFGLPDDSPDALLLRDQTNHLVHEILDEVLTEREQNVLTLRFGLDGRGKRTLKETGRIQGVSKERIRQMEAKAFRKLRMGALSECDVERFENAKKLRSLWETS